MTATPLQSFTLRLIAVDDYHQMAAMAILAADERVELIAGQIVQKTLKSPANRALCKRIEKLLERRLGDQVLVRLQDPIQLDIYSELEPDPVVVHPSENFYADHHSIPDEVYRIIEISDTTVEYDIGSKADRYATAGILDYWVINVKQQQLHICREPSPDGYQRQLILKGQQAIALLALPNEKMTVQECFGN